MVLSAREADGILAAGSRPLPRLPLQSTTRSCWLPHYELTTRCVLDSNSVPLMEAGLSQSRAWVALQGGGTPPIPDADYPLLTLRGNELACVYSRAAAADTIIKSGSERPVAMFLPENNSETMFACLGPRSRVPRTCQNLDFPKILEFSNSLRIFENIWDNPKNSQKFSNFFRFSEKK